jgi:hypothetical protein
MDIRRIRADEGLRLRDIRLRSLADSPMAYGSTLTREEAYPEAVWHERAANGAAGDKSVTFVAEHDNRLVATGLPPITSGSAPALGLYRGRGFRVTGATRPSARTPDLMECELALDL